MTSPFLLARAETALLTCIELRTFRPPHSFVCRCSDGLLSARGRLSHAANIIQAAYNFESDARSVP
jgi:hypothetical protein